MKPIYPTLLAGVLALALPAGPLMAGEVNIAVAANFTDATREIVPRFEKASGHRVKVSFGSTGKLYSQIENGAPFALFLAADTKRPAKAEAAGLAVTGSGFVYARGKLVLWSARPARFNNGEHYLRQGTFEHLALANPKTAPYGLAARQVMEHLDLWSVLQSRLVRGDSIAQTFQFAATGNADAGFVALSQIKAWKGAEGSVWQIPEAYYAPIEQGAVLLKKGADNPAARAFLEFLQGGEARKVIEGFGYGVEPPVAR